MLAGEPLNDRGGLAAQRALIGFVGDLQSREVRNVFTQGQLAVDVLTRQGFVSLVLRHQLGGQGLKGLAVLWGPPIVQSAGAIKLTALIVKAMADFVTDHGPDAPVVDGIVGLAVEEGGFQNGGRKDDFIGRRFVIGIHGLGRHVPLAAVHGLAQLGKGALPFKGGGPQLVAHRVLRPHLQLAVVAPVVGVADFDAVERQFFLRLGLGGGGHPSQLVNRLFVGGHQVGDQIFHAGLGFRREVTGHIKLSHGLAQSPVQGGGGFLPARALLFGARQGGAVEGKAGLTHRLRQDIGQAIQGTHLQIKAPVGQGRFTHEFGGTRHFTGLGHRQSRHVLELRCGKEQRPVQPRRLRLQGFQAHGVVGFERIAVVHLVPVHLGQLVFQGHHPLGGFLGGGPGGRQMGPGDQLGQIGFIGRAGFGIALVLGVQVVVPIGQAQATLPGLRQIDQRVLGVGRDAHSDRGVDQQALGAAQEPGQIGPGLNRLDFSQQGRHRGRAQGLHLGGVQVAGVEQADFLGHALRRVWRSASGAGTGLGAQLIEQILDP